MTSDQFQMAFAIENLNTDTSVTKTVANDARFVQWYAIVQKADSAGVELYTRHLMHTCTAEEFAKFYEPEKKARSKVERIQEKRGFYCLDWEELGVELQGYWQSGQEFVGLDIVAAPCGHSY